MRTKSKDNLAAQIQRIHKHCKNHRLYGIAQILVLQYNHNMSMTETNTRLHREYMACHAPSGKLWPGKERRAEELLSLMGSIGYSTSIYASQSKKNEIS